MNKIIDILFSEKNSLNIIQNYINTSNYRNIDGVFETLMDIMATWMAQNRLAPNPWWSD